MESLGLSVCNIMSSANGDVLLLPNMDAFFPPLPLALARTSSTMLNKSIREDILVLFLILEEKLSVFHS